MKTLRLATEGVTTLRALRDLLADLPGEALDQEVHLRMDSWCYNPWAGELQVNKDGAFLD